MPKPKYHIFVCTNTRPPGHPKGSCGDRGSMDVLGRLFDQIQAQNLFTEVMVNGTTCMGPCLNGPTMVVYPDGVWYGGVQPQDVDEILSQHIRQGKPVERLLLPEEVWG